MDDSDSIKYVQVEGVALMKLIKYCQVDSSDVSYGTRGILLGFDAKDRIEVTNILPFTRNSELANEIQTRQLKLLRSMNMDYLSVGYYQCMYYVDRSTVETTYNYQVRIKHCIMLTYDSKKAETGQMMLRAIKLTPTACELVKNNKFFDFEFFQENQFSRDKLFEELNVVVHNSSLMNLLLLELELSNSASRDLQLHHNLDAMNLSSFSTLQDHLRVAIETTDEMSQSLQYQRVATKHLLDKHRLAQKRQQENSVRRLQGEPPLPEDPALLALKPPPAPHKDLGPPLTLGAQLHSVACEMNKLGVCEMSRLLLLQSLIRK